MKTQCLMLLMLVTIARINGAIAQPNTDAGIFKFYDKDATFEFGDIDQGQPVEHKFKFMNIGKRPLEVKDVLVNCGCIVVKFPKQPIMPGRTGEIGVTFRSTTQVGVISKTISIISNASEPDFILQVKGFVKSRNNFEQIE